MTTTRFRSYDFFAGDRYYVEGTRIGYAACRTAYRPDGEPYHAMDRVNGPGGGRCVHLVLSVDTVSDEWLAQIADGAADRRGQIVYPPMAETGMVVPLDEDTRDADAIAEDVQRFHVDHMETCPTCTWARCAKYTCDCGDLGPDCAPES